MTAREYNQIVASHADGLYRFAYSLLGDKMDAEDVMQSVFERLWLKRNAVKIRTIKTFLFTSVHRACIDEFRKRNSRQKAFSALTHQRERRVEDQLETRQMTEHLLRQLDERQRALILLRDYEGYAYDQIAEITDLTLSQVKTQLFRARKKVQAFAEKEKSLPTNV